MLKYLKKLYFSLSHLLLRVLVKFLASAENGRNSKPASTFVYVHTEYVVVQDPWFNIYFPLFGVW